MKNKFARWILYITLVALFLLHNDFWLWDNPKVVLGLPIGLLYHIGFCAAAAILMALVVNHAWPHHLRDEEIDE
jgi:presenilin-like A22 family membrane protease